MLTNPVPYGTIKHTEKTKEVIMSVPVNKKFDNVADGIENMLEAAKYDYSKFMPPNDSEISAKMNKDFADGFVIREGVKYTRILTNNGGSCWGFVVNTDNDKKFKKGDILKCAGWSKPATNAARGNVIDGGYGINWTGPLYL